MIDKIYFEFGVQKAQLLLTIASQIVASFDQQFIDKNSKNAAIDSLIEILVHQKTQPSALEKQQPKIPNA